jgi:hypothetical protein
MLYELDIVAAARAMANPSAAASSDNVIMTIAPSFFFTTPLPWCPTRRRWEEMQKDIS